MSISFSRRRFMIGATAAAITVPSLSHARGVVFTQAACDRLSPTKVRLTWATSHAKPIDIAVSATPERKGATVLAKGVTGGVYEGEQKVKGRPYFHLSSGDADVTVAERLLPLQGGRNFRDLGGYATTDGQRLRWGTLYRSGTMAFLTTEDYAYLASLGIKVVCDFRATSERKKEPTMWQGGAMPAAFARDYELNDGFIRRALQTNASAQTVAEAMKQGYREMSYELAEHFRTVFTELAAGRVPLAFHCSAGKDRTGIATGLILSALNVPRETILKDYALSDDFVDYEAAFSGPKATEIDGPYAFIARLPREVRAPLLASDPSYLEAALAEIETRDGSVRAYLENRLGVDDSMLSAIRKNLLETV